jgi:hypothetical protein
MKKKTILSLLFCLFLLAEVNAQTYNGQLILTSQAEVDAFNYTEVTGNLTINDNVNGDITNLNGLSELTTVGGVLAIYENTTLTNLDGLSSLSSVGENIYISDNAALTNIQFSPSYVGEDLKIADNAALANINGFRFLRSVFGSLEIQNNATLTSINGFRGFHTHVSNIMR